MLLQFYTFISNRFNNRRQGSQLITTKVNIHHHNCYYIVKTQKPTTFHPIDEVVNAKKENITKIAKP